MFTSDQTPPTRGPHPAAEAVLLPGVTAHFRMRGGQMSTLQTETFDRALTGNLARLRIYAQSLTRNADRADDLVQQTVMKALAGRASFRPGTNFAAWLFRIQRNEFISEVRRNRAFVDCYEEVEHTLTGPPDQENGLMLREFIGAFRRLSGNARRALLLSQLEGLTYREISERTGFSVGTVKSRVSRGRVTLAGLVERPGHAPGPSARPASKFRSLQ